MKKNSPLPAECGEKKFHRYQQNAVKKIFSSLPAECAEKKLQIFLIFAAIFNACLKFTGNIINVCERLRSGIKSCRHAGGARFETVYGSFFCKECGEKIISPQILQKFTAFNAKICGHFAVKKVFFHRYSPLILHYFLTKPRPGLVITWKPK